MNRKLSKITRFKLPVGELLAGKYEVIDWAPVGKARFISFEKKGLGLNGR